MCASYESTWGYWTLVTKFIFGEFRSGNASGIHRSETHVGDEQPTPQLPTEGNCGPPGQKPVRTQDTRLRLLLDIWLTRFRLDGDLNRTGFTTVGLRRSPNGYRKTRLRLRSRKSV